MIIRDLNDNIISKTKHKPKYPIKEKCVFCGSRYLSPIDKYIDICQNCEDSCLEL